MMNGTRRTLFLCWLWSAVLQAWGVPARPVQQRVRMTDGTWQTIVLRGDETFHFYTTLGGDLVRKNEGGLWELDSHDVTERWSAARARRQSRRAKLAQKTRALRAPQRAASVSSEPVSRRGLLVLVNFRDVRMKWSSTTAVFHQIMNGLGAPYGKNYGSVREYFRSQSYGQLDVEFDVVGPVNLSRNMEYYGADNSEEGDDKHPGAMVKEALRAIDADVDFSLYDWDGDGEVENIFIVYAGYSQAQGAPANTIWPHQWWLSEATGTALKLDGVTIDTYACSSELMYTSGNTLDGIGTMCHEYSHCLGLPDFYDTEHTQPNFGMSFWSVMDSGCYLDNGFCPAAFTAYERWFCGWLEPVCLSSPCTVSALHDIQNRPEAYVIYNDNSPSEYYLLANHQQLGWNTFAYGHGLMVLHVYYDAKAWENNTVNNVASRQRMTIIPADGICSSNLGSLSGDLWPSSTGKTNLTNDSSPAATLYTPNTDGLRFMNKPIYGIREMAGLVTFRFMQEEPDGLPAMPWSQDCDSSRAHDILGRPISPARMGHGLYIINGRKVFK